MKRTILIPSAFIVVALIVALGRRGKFEPAPLKVGELISRGDSLDGEQVSVRGLLVRDGTDGPILLSDESGGCSREMLLLNWEDFHNHDNQVFSDLARNGQVNVIITGDYRRSGSQARGIPVEGIGTIWVSEVK